MLQTRHKKGHSQLCKTNRNPIMSKAEFQGETEEPSSQLGRETIFIALSLGFKQGVFNVSVIVLPTLQVVLLVKTF